MSPKWVSTSVRGIGVAVITSRSACLPLSLSASRCCDAEAVLLVDHGQAEIVELDCRLEQRMRADDDGGRARRRCLRGWRGARPAGCLPVSSAMPSPAASAQRLERAVVLRGEQLGRRHQRRLRAALGDRRHRHQRDHGLAGADIALQQPRHARRARRGRRGCRRSPAAGPRSARRAGRLRRAR